MRGRGRSDTRHGVSCPISGGVESMQRIAGAVLGALAWLLFSVLKLGRLALRAVVLVLMLPVLVIALPWSLRAYRRLGVPPPWRRRGMQCPECNGQQFTLVEGSWAFPEARFRCNFCHALLDAQGHLLSAPEPERRGQHRDVTGFIMTRMTLDGWPVGEFRECKEVLDAVRSQGFQYASGFGASRALDLMVERGILKPEGTGYRRVSEADL